MIKIAACALFPTFFLALTGCAQIFQSSSASLPEDAPLSGFFLMHNSGYGEMSETDAANQYRLDAAKAGGDRRAVARMHNFCADQGMLAKIQDTGENQITFVCYDKRNKKRSKVSLPRFEYVPDYSSYMEPTVENVRKVAEKFNLTFAVRAGQKLIYFKKFEDKERILPPYKKGVFVTEFDLPGNESHQLGVMYDCNDSRNYESALFAVFESVFSLTPARVLNGLGPQKFEPNSALAIV